MNRLFYIILLGLSLAFPVCGLPTTHVNAYKTIGISQIVEHPALDAVRWGLLESLKKEGFVPGENLLVYYENAQGNLVTATQIASKLLSIPLDIIIAIST